MNSIRRLSFALLLSVAVGGLSLWSAARAQNSAESLAHTLGQSSAQTQAQAPGQVAGAGLSGPRTLNPKDFPYPDSMDSVRAAPGQHWLLYEDEHVRLIEVTYRPGEKGDAPHGHPYPSVFAFDAPLAKFTDVNIDPAGKPMGTGIGPAPAGMEYPTCMTATPQAPHQPTNTDVFPVHFYRIEFKRIDGQDFKTNWAQWYPYMVKRITVWDWLKMPGVARPYGQASEPQYPKDASPTAQTINPSGFPYPDSMDSVRAAPGQHWLRYQDDHVRFLEVIYRAGEIGDAFHGHPYPSVFARDSVGGKATDENFDPAGKPMVMGQGPAPPGLEYPTCTTATPQPPHHPHNVDTFPIHFYRLEFRRIDGEAFKNEWKTWYPWMTKRGTLAEWRASHPLVQ